MPVSSRLLEHCHATFQVRAKVGPGMCGHFSKSRDRTFLHFKQSSSNMKNILSVLVFVVRIIESSKTIFLGFRGFFNLPFVHFDNLDQMRNQIGESRSKFFFHYFGEIGKDSVSEFLQIGRFSAQSFHCRLHRWGKVWTKCFSSNGNGHVTHTFQGSSAQRKKVWILQLDQTCHQVCHSLNIRREFFFSRDGGSRQGSNSHLLDTSLVGNFQHMSELSNQRIKHRSDCFGFETLAEHFQHIARSCLNSHVVVIQQTKDDRKDLATVMQNIWLAVFRNLSQAKAGTFSNLRRWVLSSRKNSRHDIRKCHGKRFGTSFGNHTKTGNARFSCVRVTTRKTFHATLQTGRPHKLFGYFASNHVKRALGHASFGGTVQTIVVVIIVSFAFQISLPSRI
mmetsp:Transcript_26124/g.54523  ORF Transcript_26124/g.54523 Transcript_26124/m.54523 type:complete len:393 (-) Transcript_26124:19-1197(-)